jgi:uncharacterized protein (DUF305 family)
VIDTRDAPHTDHGQVISVQKAGLRQGGADVLHELVPALRLGLLITVAGFILPACQRETARAPIAADTAPIVQPGAPGQPSREVPVGTVSPHAPAATAADIAFMQGMIRHHAQALEMVALLETRTSRADLKLLAKRIDISQADEIRMMKTWLADRGVPEPADHAHSATMMPGMLSADQMTALSNARGPAFDRLFLTGMIQHHQGALAMVEDLLNAPGAGQESILADFVSHVDADQRMEITRMAALLKDLP